ncbi:MAG: MFS transporter [Candidatus Lokiarchaeota archaeon]|nr:MFS transporter [Candidatus Lokiarchaeota archaeon]
MIEEKIQVYGYRWIILIIFMLVNIFSQILWISYATVTLEATTYYNVSEFEILFLSTIFMIAYIPVTFITSWFINKYGFRIGVGFGALLNGVFGFLRFLAGPNYLLILLFHILIAVSQPFFLNSVTLLSANWFPESERTTATGLSIISQLLGIALGMILTPILVMIFSFEVMLFIYGLCSLIIGILFVIVARDRPPTSPSIKLTNENIIFKGGLKLLLFNKLYWILIIIFLVGLGAFNMVTTYIELIVIPRGLTSIEAGNLGGIMLLGGIVGSIMMSILSDKFRKRTLLIKISLLIAVAAFFAISFANNAIMLYIFGFLLGFGLLSVGPVVLEYTVEITVPVPEATSNGMLMMVGAVGGIIFILGFEGFTTPSGDYLPALIVLSILSLVSFILSFFLKDVKRE